MIVTRNLAPAQLADYFRDHGAEVLAVVARAIAGRAVLVDDEIAAVGFLHRHVANVVYADGERREDRVWIEFDADGPAHQCALAIVRAARDMLKNLREPVYAIGDEQQYTTAPRLLGLCGFQPTVQTWGGERIWQKLP